MKNILLIRHGQSEWNKLNLFTGFKNIELSEQGIDEANKAGQNFKNLNIKFDIVFTSELKRAQETAKIILKNLDHVKSWYGKNSDVGFYDHLYGISANALAMTAYGIKKSNQFHILEYMECFKQD